jgi:hypothetical protein
MMQTIETEPADANGRDQSGKFSAGNGFGKGNPTARHAQRLRQLFVTAVTEQDIRDIVLKLVELAKAGDIAAANLLLTRALGKPSTTETTLPLDNTPITELQQVTNLEQAREYTLRLQPDITNEMLTIKANAYLRIARHG